MRFLLTRPLEDSRILAEKLEKAGHEVFTEPMMSVRNLPFEARELPAGCQALVFTSANGVRAFIHHFAARDLPVYAVGPATAEEARQNGFKDIKTGHRDVEKLAELIKNDPDLDKKRPLLHVAGTVVAGDLAKLLSEVGFRLDRWQLYDAEPARSLSPDLLEKLDQGKIDAIPFYSPRTARIFRDLVQQAGREGPLSRIKALCLSDAIKDVLDSMPWENIRVAPEPREQSLFRMINIDL